jgi:hypothetical protein
VTDIHSIDAPGAAIILITATSTGFRFLTSGHYARSTGTVPIAATQRS